MTVGEVDEAVREQGGEAAVLLDELIAKREELEQDTEHAFALPGNHGRLFARYRLLRWEQVKPVLAAFGPDGGRRRGGAGARKDPQLAARFLRDACVEVFLGHEGDDDEPVPEPWPDRVDLGGTVMLFDERLAEALRVPEPRNGWNVLRLVRRVLDPRDSETPMFAHVGEVVGWMAGEHGEVSDRFVGE